MDGWMDWMDGWMDGWVNWMDGLDGWKNHKISENFGTPSSQQLYTKSFQTPDQPLRGRC